VLFTLLTCHFRLGKIHDADFFGICQGDDRCVRCCKADVDLHVVVVNSFRVCRFRNLSGPALNSNGSPEPESVTVAVSVSALLFHMKS